MMKVRASRVIRSSKDGFASVARAWRNISMCSGPAERRGRAARRLRRASRSNRQETRAIDQMIRRSARNMFGGVGGPCLYGSGSAAKMGDLGIIVIRARALRHRCGAEDQERRTQPFLGHRMQCRQRRQSMSSQKQVGLIGVGLMGHGIATNILKGGYALRFLDHPGNRPAADLVAQGAVAAPTAAGLAAHSDIVLLCVTGTPQVEDVLFREDGVLAGMTPGTIVIDCSTAIPASTRTVAARIAKAGGSFSMRR